MVFALFPLSQIIILGIADLVVFAYQAPVEDFYFVSLCALLCIPADLILIRKLTATEGREVARLNIALLEEQMALQGEVRARIQTDILTAKEICEKAHDQLQDVQDALNAKQAGHLNADIAQTLKVIEGQGQHFCDHRALDALLGIKYDQCRDKGIETEFNLAVPHTLGIASTDLCALFFNLIDNAIHACCALEPGSIPANDQGERILRGRIVLNASMVGSMLVVDMCNSVARKQSKFFRKKKASGLDEHGWGLSILEQLTHRYGGSLSIEQKGDEVVTTVLLPVEGAICSDTAAKRHERSVL